MDTNRREKTNGLSKVLMVGFPFPTASFIENHNEITEEGKIVMEFKHPLACIDFLNTVDSSEISAILIDLPTIEKDQYRFLATISQEIEWEAIPIIAIAPGWTKVDRVALMKKGLDDCYVEPINWRVLKRRIEFLHEFKVHKDIEFSFSATEYKIPLGKRLFDIAFASAVILVASPLLIFVALAVKLTSKGDVFYLSKRAGTGYKVFDFIKFRSMAQGADKQIKDLAHLNNYDGDDKGAVFVKLKNDPRVTRIGKIIRKLSIDELPQLFNVLKGDMSIVGNRPLPLYEAEQLTKDAWAARFIAPAGLTGLWQTAKGGKVNISNEQRIAFDIEYAETSSFLTDMKIIARTLPAMLQKGE